MPTGHSAVAGLRTQYYTGCRVLPPGLGESVTPDPKPGVRRQRLHLGVLKTTVIDHPPSSADHPSSGPVTRGATTPTPKAFCLPQRGRHIVIGRCGQPRVRSGEVSGVTRTASVTSRLLCAD